MALGSLIAGIAALLLMIGGMFLTVVPFAGTILSFLAPVTAIAGIVLGGLAMSRAKRDGEPTGLATGGLIVNVVMLIPTLLVAVTCGLCNACFTAGSMAPRRDGGDSFAYDYDFQAGYVDGGTVALGASPPPVSNAPGVPTGPPTEAELAAEVDTLNELCGDTFCEGEFDYRFQSLGCEARRCTLKFSAKHYRSEDDYAEHSVELPVAGEIVECTSWEYRGGDEVCTGRGLTEEASRALGEALWKWEEDNRPAQ